MVACLPDTLSGLRFVDIGAGAGAVSLALLAAGASVVAVDGSVEMLLAAEKALPGLTTIVADATDLPFDEDSFDGATSGFCLNHLPVPHLLLREAARVVRPRGHVLASTFAAGKEQRAKYVVERVARRWGWKQPAWYGAYQRATRLTDSVDGLKRAARLAGLVQIQVHAVEVDTGLRTAADLVRWRLGMAGFSEFLQGLGRKERAGLAADAEAELRRPSPEPLRREVLIVSSRVPA